MLTVTEPASNRKLTTAATAKLELQVASGGDDAYLSMLIDQASAAVENWCARSFAFEAVREVAHQAAAQPALLLARWPVVSITSLAVNGVAADPAATEVGDNGLLYRLGDDNRRRFWPAGRIVVEYRAGYVMPGEAGRTLPADVERAALTLIKAHWHSRNRDPLIRSETIDGAGSTDYFAGTVSQLPPEVESLLAPHRNLTFG